MKMVDVFGDGKHVYPENKLPPTIATDDGIFNLQRGVVGISYVLYKPTKKYLDRIKEAEKLAKPKKSKVELLEARIKKLEEAVK